MLVAVWMSLIFYASTDALSSGRTSRIIGPVLRWFDPEVRDETVRRVQFVVRKCAHVVEYGVLALLLLNALRRQLAVERWLWCRRCAWFAFWGAVFYAVTDEWHQSFVPSRDGRFTDVLIDSLGAAGAVLGCWALFRLRRRWKTPPTGDGFDATPSSTRQDCPAERGA